MIARRTAVLRLATSLALGAGLVGACGGGAAARSATTTVAPARVVAPPRYGAGGPWRYAFDRIDTLEFTLPNGGKQVQVLERHLQLRWAVTKSGDTLQLRVTLDSVRLVLSGGASGRALEDSARGSAVTALLAADGRLSGLGAAPDNTVTHAFVSELAWLTPLIPASLGEGAARTDTLDSTVRFGVVDLSQRIVRQTAVAITPGEFDLSGTITRDGVSPSLRLTGSGVRTGHAAVGSDGAPRAAAGRDSLAMTASVAETGQSVQLIQIGTYTLTPLP